MCPAVIKGLVGLHRIPSYCAESAELSHHSADELLMIQKLAGAQIQSGAMVQYASD